MGGTSHLLLASTCIHAHVHTLQVYIFTDENEAVTIRLVGFIITYVFSRIMIAISMKMELKKE